MNSDQSTHSELTVDGQYETTVTIPAASSTDSASYCFIHALYDGASEEEMPDVPSNLRWEDTTAAWDPVESADHYRVVIQKGYSSGDYQSSPIIYLFIFIAFTATAAAIYRKKK